MKVKKNDSEKAEIEKSYAQFEKLVKISLIIGIITISGFIIYYLLTPEPGYVTFGILNSEKKSENYPTNTSIGQTIEFYATVENHLGRDFDFKIKIYKGNNHTILSSKGSNATVNYTSKKYNLKNNQGWDRKYSMKFFQVGSNQLIIVELWQVIDEKDEFYDILWLRLNITTS